MVLLEEVLTLSMSLFLSAKGVGLGRPFLNAMHGYGEENVVKVIEILKKEIRNNIISLGEKRLEVLNEAMEDISNLTFRIPTTNGSLSESIYKPIKGMDLHSKIEYIIQFIKYPFFLFFF